MLPSERHQAILREIELRGGLTVADFAARFRVSAMTIRRDLLELETEGVLERVHGGAVRRRAPRDKGLIATIGFIVPSARYYFPGVIAGAKHAAADLGARLVLGISDYSGDAERHQIRRLLERGVDGLVVTPSEPYRQDPATYRLLADAEPPTIVMERSLVDAPSDILLGAVRTDHAHGAKVALRHLVDAGRTRIALGVRRGPTAEPLRDGYRRALGDLLPGAEPIELEIARVERPVAEQRASLAAVVDACAAQRVDGLIVLPDEAAIGLVDLAVDRGIDVPRDLAVVAYDDEVASLAEVPITAVAPPKADVGAMAVRACFERITRGERVLGGPAHARIDLLPTLTVRGSSSTETSL
ncbi:substrate-binding domain-containing protein [Microbacterium gilvum]|uniref:Substrate-binding domain-containing protein n=1 Tax=Microbacterium gilvum TaxID=1336204 RepID=A0ABP9AGU9_9MICO